jgi:hypothetical protein
MVRDLDSAKQKVLGLGGRLIEEHRDQSYHWWVVADPEENEFCIIASTDQFVSASERVNRERGPRRASVDPWFAESN